MRIGIEHQLCVSAFWSVGFSSCGESQLRVFFSLFVPSASPHRRRGHRSRSRSPHRRHSRSRSRSRSPHRRRHRSKSRSKSPEKSSSKKSKKSEKSEKSDKKKDKDNEGAGMSKEELEIIEANELRAKLGLKPLKPWKTFICVHVKFIHQRLPRHNA